MKSRLLPITLLLCISSIVVFGQRAELVLPTAGLGVVKARYSPDGKIIVTATSDPALKIWDAQTGKNLYTLGGHTGHINALDFSPDGRYIVSASYDKTTRIWDAQTGKLLHILQSGKPVDCAVYSPHGKRIAVQLDDVSAEVWDAQTGKLVYTMTGHTDKINSVRFSPDGKSVVTSSWDGTVKVWDGAAGKLLKTITGEDGRFDDAVYTIDGTRILTTGASVKLWDAQTGKPVFTILAKTEGSRKPFDASFRAEYSRSGTMIVTFSNDANTKWEDCKTNIWDPQTGKPLFGLARNGADKVKISADGKRVITIRQEIVELWDGQSGRLISTMQHTKDVRDADLSPDNRQIVTCSDDRTARVWDAENGKLLHTLEGIVQVLWNARFSPDGETMAVFFEDNILKIWDMKDGGVLHVLDGKDDEVRGASYSPDGKRLAVASWSDAKCWDVASGKLLYTMQLDNWGANKVNYSPDGKSLATAYRFSAKTWEAQSGRLLRPFNGHSEDVLDAVYSANGQVLATVSRDKTAKLWDVSTSRVIHTLEHNDEVSAAGYSPDGKSLVTVSADNTARLWDVQSGKMLHLLEGHTWHIVSAGFSPDGRKIITASRDNTAKVWDAQTGNLMKSLDEHTNQVLTAMYTPDGKSIVTASQDRTAKIWNAADHSLQTTIQLNGDPADISFNVNQIVSQDYSSLHFVDLKSGSTIARVAFIDEKDWVVTHPSGLFDASPGAMDKLYFVQGLDMIDFTQLKQRYYEPGLWRKAMSGEKLRNVVGMKSIDLPPTIRLGRIDAKGYLPIELINRGGGIGEVNVFINGKEVVTDARPKDADSKASKLIVSAFVGNHKSLIKGVSNFIAVKAWNESHWVVSRSEVVNYSIDEKTEPYQPAVHIIAIGTSDYRGTELDLRYAAKDAEDFKNALQLGAIRLFGTARSYVYSLTTSEASDHQPTKDNIIKTFQTVSSTAHPLDIVVVYFSGHGINHGGQDGDWYYLTQDAHTSNSAAYADPEIRRIATLSSNELVELFKTVPALKQVLIIDACASGKVVENLMTKRDIESTTLRALDRMRDRTGLHIITGCAADAVSYEASKYGQGVLTYSLLEGMRGAALRENEFVDVNKLFQYAHDRVPFLAEGIGGIQTPQVFSPQGGQSFDIGQLTEREKQDIPLARVKPVYIRSTFIDDDQLEDALELGKKVDDALSEVSGKGTEASLVFVDVREYPEGCKLSGRYKQEGGEVRLRLRKKCEGTDETIEVLGKTAEELKSKVLGILSGDHE